MTLSTIDNLSLRYRSCGFTFCQIVTRIFISSPLHCIKCVLMRSFYISHNIQIYPKIIQLSLLTKHKLTCKCNHDIHPKRWRGKFLIEIQARCAPLHMNMQLWRKSNSFEILKNRKSNSMFQFCLHDYTHGLSIIELSIIMIELIILRWASNSVIFSESYWTGERYVII